MRTAYCIYKQAPWKNKLDYNHNHKTYRTHPSGLTFDIRLIWLAFSWQRSPEGYSYWIKIHRHWTFLFSKTCNEIV